MPALRTLASLALAAAVAACAAPTPAAPPKADPAAVEAEIKAKVASWNEYIAARNDSAIGELYADDGVLMPPNQPRIAGKEGIRAFFAGMWVINPTMVLNTTQVVTSDAGDVAIEEGTFALEYRGADGKPINDTGKYLVIWKRTGNDWKVVRDIFNTDLPSAPTPK
jgi:ketosteroid isomerase-like protein